MFDDAEWSQIIDRLLDLTQRNLIKWAFEESVITAKVGQVEYVLGSVDKDGRQPFFLHIWRPDSETIAARLESTPGPDDEVPWSGLSAAEKVSTLHAAAVRSASGAGELFDELMADLKRIDEPPF